MNFIREIFAIPFGYALHVLYSLNIDYIVSLILITLVVRVALLPSSIKQQKNSAKQMRLQAKVNKIRQKYAGNNSRENQMKISEETQELYKREGFNATTQGCAPLIITLVVMMGLYGAIYAPISKVIGIKGDELTAIEAAYESVAAEGDDSSKKTNNTYRIELDVMGSFDKVTAAIEGNEEWSKAVKKENLEKISDFIRDFRIFGIDLTSTPSEEYKAYKETGKTPDGANIIGCILMPVFAGISALLTSLYTYLKQRKTNPEMAKNPAMGCMTFMSPLISVVFAWTLPAGIGFYWIISGLLSFIQTVALGIALKPEAIIAGQMIDETVERRSREKSVKERNAILAKHNSEN